MSMMRRLRALIVMVMMVAMLAVGGSAAAAGPGWGDSTPDPNAGCVTISGRVYCGGFTVGGGGSSNGPQISNRYLFGN